MIAHLRGTVTKHDPEVVSLDVNGVGYRVYVPLDVWDELENDTEVQLFTSSYIREDRFDLYGFADTGSRLLFEKFIGMNGVGPKLGLELCAVPKNILLTAVSQQDPALLTTIKGIGKKTAEKLLLDLKNVAEKQPEIFGDTGVMSNDTTGIDQDAIDALKTLGYDTSTIMQVLKDLPEDLGTTEERVTAALRTL